MPHGGALTIETSCTHLDEAYAGQHAEVQPGDYVMIAVSDSGTGMAPEILARVFEPFFTTKGESGTGLGLWITSGIVKNHDGRIRVRSNMCPGCTGTCFSVFLPLKQELMEKPEELRQRA
jgi:signal transduction histidine kinase